MSIVNIRHKVLSASGTVATGPGNIYGIMVNSHTNGTIKVWDSMSEANDVIFDTITLAAGSGMLFMFPGGINFSVGLTVTIGGTANITVLWGGLQS